jgi:hypothetical protein
VRANSHAYPRAVAPEPANSKGDRHDGYAKTGYQNLQGYILQTVPSGISSKGVLFYKHLTTNENIAHFCRRVKRFQEFCLFLMGS